MALIDSVGAIAPADRHRPERLSPPRSLAQRQDALDTPAHPHLTRELLAAWQLLLIARQASHGYSLRRALEAIDVHPDAGTLCQPGLT